ncbi:hypothetical protein BBF93_18490 [Hyphomonas sp. CACIAM 19H1]|uniref:hypothetical protein n=1 Tax=Hyphomonas sp. CACIAM 19H1 TaxID=1873716 RepID=UPI000DEE0AA2|nr:hypothetical protein [Hyphomonas sp. CACIAM 19H1]AXE66003.1 hypothetical protein BBF93_18490 [Hyphomonas sp. CACIAM 19H1]
MEKDKIGSYLEKRNTAEYGAITTLGASLGSLFTILWVALVAFIFVGLLDRAQNDVELLKTMLWPSIVVGLGVPLIVFVWFGGVSIVSELARLRGHLAQLDKYVSSFQDMEETSKDIAHNISVASSTMDSSAASITNASNALNANVEQIKSEIEPIVTRFESIATGRSNQTANSVERTSQLDQIKDRFSEILKAADAVFYAKLSERNESPGRGNRRLVVAPGGTNKGALTEELRDKLTETEFSFLRTAYKLDMNSRLKGRSNITEEDLIKLDRLNEQVG